MPRPEPRTKFNLRRVLFSVALGIAAAYTLLVGGYFLRQRRRAALHAAAVIRSTERHEQIVAARKIEREHEQTMRARVASGASSLVGSRHAASSSTSPAAVAVATETATEARRRPVVAFAITMTRDGPYVDGAAVLAQGVRRAHRLSRGPGAATDDDALRGDDAAFAAAPYDAALVALVHPSVSNDTRARLAFCGWRVLERPTPVALDEIRGTALREKIASTGCCGADELIKVTIIDCRVVLGAEGIGCCFNRFGTLFLGAGHSPVARLPATWLLSLPRPSCDARRDSTRLDAPTCAA